MCLLASTHPRGVSQCAESPVICLLQYYSCTVVVARSGTGAVAVTVACSGSDRKEGRKVEVYEAAIWNETLSRMTPLQYRTTVKIHCRVR